MEADYDKAVKECQARNNITVRWDKAMNKKVLAHLIFPRDDSDLRLMIGEPLSEGCDLGCAELARDPSRLAR